MSMVKTVHDATVVDAVEDELLTYATMRTIRLSMMPPEQDRPETTYREHTAMANTIACHQLSTRLPAVHVPAKTHVAAPMFANAHKTAWQYVRSAANPSAQNHKHQLGNNAVRISRR
jgi:hypothetical protein